MTSPRNLTVLEQLDLASEGKPARSIVTSARVLTAPLVGRYARISDDQEDETTGDAGLGKRGAGVRRQLQQVDAVITAREWQASDIDYTDNDLSAFKTNVIRPGFERMLEDLEAGVLDGIACYDLDRFVRRPDDLERAIRIYDRAKLQGRPMFFASVQGDINLSSEDGVAFARVLVAFANKSSRDTSRRLRLKHAENRDLLIHVGGTRPFGWQWVREDIVDAGSGSATAGERSHILDPAESSLMRQTAAEIIERQGASWTSIAGKWNAKGFRSTRGNAFTTQTVKQLMLSPRIAGWMTHRGSIATHSQTGLALRGKFPAILDDETYRQLLVAIGKRASGATAGQDGRRKYLLAGLVRCGSCGTVMDGNARTDRSSATRHYYVCKRGSRLSPDGSPACGKVSCSGVGLDQLIVELVMPRVIASTKAAALAHDLPNTARLMDIGDERSFLLTEHREGRLSAEAVFPAVAQLEAEAGLLRLEQERWLRSQGTARLAAGMTAKRWMGKEIEIGARRALVAEQISAVYVAGATRRTGSKFDHSRATPVWRDSFS